MLCFLSVPMCSANRFKGHAYLQCLAIEPGRSIDPFSSKILPRESDFLQWYWRTDLGFPLSFLKLCIS